MDEPSPPDPLSPMGRGGTLRESIDRLLDRVALSTSEGIEVAPDRVNLLTLHSTKGLEFSRVRSEEHTSELQSRLHLVCRLLLEKKKKKPPHMPRPPPPKATYHSSL